MENVLFLPHLSLLRMTHLDCGALTQARTNKNSNKVCLLISIDQTLIKHYVCQQKFCQPNTTDKNFYKIIIHISLFCYAQL